MIGRTLCDLVTEPYKGVFRIAVAPPVVQGTWYSGRHLELERGKTRCTGASRRLRLRPRHRECVVEPEQSFPHYHRSREHQPRQCSEEDLSQHHRDAGIEAWRGAERGYYIPVGDNCGGGRGGVGGFPALLSRCGEGDRVGDALWLKYPSSSTSASRGRSYIIMQ